MNSKLQYAVVEVHSDSVDFSPSNIDGKKKLGNVLNQHDKLLLIVALDLVPTLEAKWGKKLVLKKTFTGSQLENCRSCLAILI